MGYWVNGKRKKWVTEKDDEKMGKTSLDTSKKFYQEAKEKMPYEFS